MLWKSVYVLLLVSGFFIGISDFEIAKYLYWCPLSVGLSALLGIEL